MREINDKIDNENIDILNISKNLINTLKENKIEKIGQLRKKSKKDLGKINIQQSEAIKINVELQLLGSALKGSL